MDCKLLWNLDRTAIAWDSVHSSGESGANLYKPWDVYTEMAVNSMKIVMTKIMWTITFRKLITIREITCCNIICLKWPLLICHITVWGSVDRAVASETRGLWFESSHQNFLRCILSTVWRKKRAAMAQFFKSDLLVVSVRLLKVTRGPLSSQGSLKH